jgi:hypothetical protein
LIFANKKAAFKLLKFRKITLVIPALFFQICVKTAVLGKTDNKTGCETIFDVKLIFSFMFCFVQQNKICAVYRQINTFK